MEKREMRGHPSTQVIMAALNEEESIGPTLLVLNKTLRNPRILVVDGRSTDRTVEIAKSLENETLPIVCVKCGAIRSESWF